MKNKICLLYIEQIIMVFVFALAAAMCVQAFALSNRLSLRNEERSRAMMASQNAAEIFQSARGDSGLAAELYGGSSAGGRWTVRYDDAWQVLDASAAEAEYTLVVERVESDQPFLGLGSVSMRDSAGELLCSFFASWQEVASNGS